MCCQSRGIPRDWQHIVGHGQLRSEEHTSELQSQSNLVCRLLLEKKKKNKNSTYPLTEPKPPKMKKSISQSPSFSPYKPSPPYIITYTYPATVLHNLIHCLYTWL